MVRNSQQNQCGLGAITLLVFLFASGFSNPQPPIIPDTVSILTSSQELDWPIFLPFVQGSSYTPTPNITDSPFTFTQSYVDTDYGGNGRPGWARAGDMDGDGDTDITAGGGRALFIYENDGSAGGWTRFGSLDSTGNIGSNGGILYDVDQDGDLDVVAAQYYSHMGWWENPGGPLSHTPWAFHKFADTTWYLHDIFLADLDQDGKAEEIIVNLNSGYWDAPAKLKWFRPGDDPEQAWEVHTIDDYNPGSNHSHAGLDVGDVDRDGHLDLAFSQGWYEAPDDPAGTWTWHQVGNIYGTSNSLLRDMDTDGDLDMVVSAGHHGSGVYWFAAPSDPKSGTWVQHTIDSTITNPECLAVVDLNQDSDLDVITCDLDFDHWNQEVHNVYVLKNTGNSAGWNKLNVAPNSYPSHLLQMFDINHDGQLDIISEAAGYSVVSYYENIPTTSDPIENTFAFDLAVVDSSYPGNGRPGWSASGDIDQDGQVDIVSGGGKAIQWYEAPNWTSHPIETNSNAGGNGGLVFDVDRDGDLDILAALYMAELVWWENPGSASAMISPWQRHTIDSTNPQGFNHDLAYGDIDGDGNSEVVALYVGTGGGVVWYDVPDNPTSNTWSKTTILSSISDPYVGLTLGDIDRDGDVDVIASNKWYERPADPRTPNWIGRNFFDSAVQNVFAYDVNLDGRLDIVAAEGFVYPNGRIIWVECPEDPKSQSWAAHIVGSGMDGPENIWAGDLDNDGDTEIVSAEMGTSTGWYDNDSNFIVFEGLSPTGDVWDMHIVAENVGVSARINPIDIDNDGDFDFTADGNAENHIYLWRNNSSDGVILE